MGIGIDKGEGDEMFEVTVQIARISGLKSSGSEGQGMGVGGKAYINICRSGEGIQMPMRDIARFIDRELYTGHNQVIVIGSEVAKGNIAPILDFFIRSADGRFAVALLIAKGRAYDILDHSSEMENLPATYLQSLIGERANGGNAPDATMINFLRDMLSSTTAPTIPIAEVVEDEKGEAQVILSGMGVFRGAGMCGVLRPEESQAVLAVKNKVNSGYCRLEALGGHIGLRFLSSESKITPEYRDGKFKITVNLKQKAEIIETTLEADLLSIEVREELAEIVSRDSLRKFSDILAYSKSESLDVFGFGEELYRRFPRESREVIKNWESEYPHLEVCFGVETVLLGSGAILKPLTPSAEAD